MSNNIRRCRKKSSVVTQLTLPTIQDSMPEYALLESSYVLGQLPEEETLQVCRHFPAGGDPHFVVDLEFECTCDKPWPSQR
jgi:hypothetical protein